jgi:sugar phosphate isomerase/epimerase
MKKIRLAFLILCCAVVAVAADAKEKFPVKVGMAGYTFVNFDLDYTLAALEKLDVHYLCVKDFHLPLDSTDAQMEAFRQKLAAKNVVPYAAGPIYMKTEAEVDRAFDYARRLGVTMIVAVPNLELLPYVNGKVQEYDMRIAIHLHGPDIELYPNATDAWNHIKDLDPRMGICMDVGHNLRTGDDPVADIKHYHKRIFDIHIKDVTAPTKAGVGIELGRGLIDFPALVKTLRALKYEGVCSLEYEKDMKDPMLGIAESIGFFKGVCAW